MPARSRLPAPWLAELPPSWSSTQLRHVVRFRNGADYKDIEVLDGGYPVYGSGGEFRRASSYLYEGPSVLFGRKGTIDKPLLVDGRFWTVDTMFFTEVGQDLDPRYLHYYATTMPFDYYATKTAVPSMTQNDLGGHVMPLPTGSEQRAIADFLDRETAQIDTLIAKQQQLIAILRERRASVSEVLLAPAVACGPRLKQALIEVDERAGIRAKSLPLLSVSISWGVRRRVDVTADPTRSDDLSRYKVCGPEDIVLNRMRAFQGSLGVADETGIVSPDYSVLRTTGDVDPRWLAAVMKTSAFVGEISARIKGIGGTEGGSVRTPRINIADLREIRVSVPASATQRQLLDRIGYQHGVIDLLIERAGRFIELSRERRSALITAAVIGQIDVRGAA